LPPHVAHVAPSRVVVGGWGHGANGREGRNGRQDGRGNACLFLPPVKSGRAPIHEKLLRPIVAGIDWGKQREMWAGLKRV